MNEINYCTTLIQRCRCAGLRGRKWPKQPRVILITGATAGLGEGLALAYAKPGVTLILTGRNAQRLEAVAAACAAKRAQPPPP